MDDTTGSKTNDGRPKARDAKVVAANEADAKIVAATADDPKVRDVADDGVPATAEATNALADALAAASVWIFNYRRSTAPEDDAAQLRDLEDALDRDSIRLRAKAIALLGDETDDAIDALSEAAHDVDAFMDDVKDDTKALSVVTAVLRLSAAALTGDTHTIVKAAMALGKQLA